MAVDVEIVPERDGLDTIRVYFEDVGPGKGYVTFLVWGSAWTAYFGGMGDSTIRQFVARADVGYLCNKMGYTQHLKQAAKNMNYLARIVTAVKAHLKEGQSR